MATISSDESARFEAALNRGLDKIEEQLKMVNRDIGSLRERIAAIEVKVAEIKDVGEHVESVEERLRQSEAVVHENKGRDRVVAASAGFFGAGLLTLVLRWIGSI